MGFFSINDKKKKKKSDTEYLQLGSCKELLQLLISVIMGDNFDGLTWEDIPSGSNGNIDLNLVLQRKLSSTIYCY